MGVTGARRRRRLGAFALAVGSSLALGIGPARSEAVEDAPPSPTPISRLDTGDDFLSLTNADRIEGDLEPLTLAERLSRYAARHSRRMAELGYIFHSGEVQLREALEGTGWAVAGENVGVGPSLEGLEEAFMASRPHRRNILGHSYDRVAIGAVEADGVVWITVIFYGD
jgi:uncharacterized protein YkwD